MYILKPCDLSFLWLKKRFSNFSMKKKPSYIHYLSKILFWIKSLIYSQNLKKIINIFLKSLAGILILSTLFSISGSIRWETEMESQKYTWMIWGKYTVIVIRDKKLNFYSLARIFGFSLTWSWSFDTVVQDSALRIFRTNKESGLQISVFLMYILVIVYFV